MTDEELSRIQARAEATPAGPWFPFCDHQRDLSWLCNDKPYAHVGREGDNYMIGPFDVLIEPDEDPHSINPRDKPRVAALVEFIAHARSDIPALLAEVKRLRGRDECATQYEEDVAETNQLLDEAGLHIGSGDLSTLVRALIRDADNGREALKKAVAEERERCAKLRDAMMRAEQLCLVLSPLMPVEGEAADVFEELFGVVQGALPKV